MTPMRKHAIFVALTLNIDRYPKNEQRTEIKCSALMENTGLYQGKSRKSAGQ